MHIWHDIEGGRQKVANTSFIGGIPMLPSCIAVPKSPKTSSDMTFFFQIELPSSHKWAGFIISVFAVTDHVDDESYLPKLPTSLRGAQLDACFFENYQTFFRSYVFPRSGAVTVSKYEERVAFKALKFSERLPKSAKLFGLMKPEPVWVLDNEAPASFEGRADAITFLLQTRIDYEFDTVEGAPRQKVESFVVPKTSELEDSLSPEYTLFVANELFFFGIDGGERRVYVVPQS